MVHLDELQAKYGEKGLTVIGLTNEARGLVDKFVGDTKATHPIVIEETDSAASYGISGFPTSYLIDADGKVVWTGHPGNLTPDVIESNLKNVRLVPQLPAKYAPIQKMLEGRKFGDARKALEKAAADEKASDEEKKAVADVTAWLDDSAKRRMDGATADAIKGDAVSAAESFEKLAEQWKGTETGDAAAKGLKDLLADPAKKKEIDAARKLADVKERISGLKAKKAIPIVKGLVSGTKGTKAGEEAQKLLEKLVAEEEKGN